MVVERDAVLDNIFIDPNIGRKYLEVMRLRTEFLIRRIAR